MGGEVDGYRGVEYNELSQAYFTFEDFLFVQVCGFRRRWREVKVMEMGSRPGSG